MIIGAGELRDVATIETKSGTGFAGEPGSWATFATLRCKVRPVRGSERMENGKDTSIVTYRILSRWMDSVTAGMRIKHGARTLAIVAVLNPDGMGRYMEIEAEERS